MLLVSQYTYSTAHVQFETTWGGSVAYMGWDKNSNTPTSHVAVDFHVVSLLQTIHRITYTKRGSCLGNVINNTLFYIIFASPIVVCYCLTITVVAIIAL